MLFQEFAEFKLASKITPVFSATEQPITDDCGNSPPFSWNCLAVSGIYPGQEENGRYRS
jgi:hypothetical protein